MDENQDPKIFQELSSENRSKPDEEGPGVDPGNSPPEEWTEDLTADEIDAVATQLDDHLTLEEVLAESTPKEENL